MIRVLLALLLALNTASLGAQEGSASPAPAGTAEGPAAATAPEAPPPEETPKTADELVSSTLARDIATASYYELTAWCLQLGLDDAGSRTDLQARLAAHYGVTLPAPPTAEGKTVTIRSAREASYTTDERAGEKYLSLRGDVVLEVKDEANGTLQEIKAASLTYNQTRRKVSAVGNVTYTLTHGNQTDTFTGASLAFDLDSSEAVFYDGSTTRIVNRGGKSIPYTFQGATITRLTNDTVILQEGNFTTSDTPDDPLFRIHTTTAWLLAPGEWAAQNALLMIGRVPILYLPGFFWPGEEFLFNPNVGYKDREGSFVQTTTYLIGRKQAQDAPFSFLQLSSAGSEGYGLERDGLFLRKVPTTPGAKPGTDTLTLLLDAYSRLGVFAGVSGDFTPLGSFRTGIAVSRSVFLDQAVGGLYTPYLPVPVAGYMVGQSVWNSSTLLGLTVPFRYGFDGTLKTTGNVLSLSAGFQYYSDPSFTSDFYSRSEAGILANLVPKSKTTATTAPSQSNLSWDLTGRFDFSRLVNSPLAQTVSIPTIGARMAWQSYLPGSGSLSIVQQYDPGTAFYFPTSITAPNAIVSLAGTLLSLPAAPGNQAGAGPAVSTGSQASGATPAAGTAPTAGTQDPGKGFRYPSAPSGGKPATEAAPRVPFRAPAPQPDLPGAQARGASSLTVSYQVQPRATLEHTYDTQGWTSRDSVDYRIRYRTLEMAGSSSITAAASLLDRTADVSLGLTADGLWRDRFDPSAKEAVSADWQSLTLRDLQQDRLGLRSSLQGTLRPFLDISAFSSSTLQYRLGVRLYQLSWDQLSGTVSPVFSAAPLSWGTDTITEHSLVSTLAFAAPWTNDSLSLTAQLPPLIPTMTGALNVGAGPLKGRLQGGFAQPASGVQYQPLVASLSADLGNSMSAAEEVQLDIAGGTWQRSTSTLSLGPLSGAFIAQYMFPLNGAGIPVPGGTEGLLPYTVRIGYETGGNPRWFWKDRIKVDLSVKTHWTVNVQRYTDNLFDFTLGLTFNIYKALDLTFSSYSTNNKTYRYIPDWADGVGEAWVNPIVDLASSFAFWNPDARQRSSFKIRTLAVTAVQHFPDWDLSFQYQGSPQLRVDPADGRQKFVWTRTFSILAQWNAVPEVKSNVQGDTSGVTLR